MNNGINHIRNECPVSGSLTLEAQTPQNGQTHPIRRLLPVNCIRLTLVSTTST